MRSAFRPILLLLVVAACRAGTDRPVDSAGADSIPADSGAMAAAPRFASDGTLSLLTMSPLTPILRTVADSFAVREAVRVLIDTLPVFEGSPESAASSADVVALSTTTLTERFLATEQSTWSLPFARNRVVLAWTDSSRRATSIDSASWRRVLTRRDTRVGRVDPAAAPLGVFTLLAMQLAETALEDRGLAARLLAASPAARVYPSRDSLEAAVRAGAVDVIWTYESAARAAGLRWLQLGPAVDLGDEAHAATYATATTVLLPSLPTDSSTRRDSAAPAAPTPAPTPAPARADSLLVRGTPLRYALTISRHGSNPAMAERFVRFLFSTEGRRILMGGAFEILDPLIATGSAVPAVVATLADSVVLPVERSDATPARRP